MEKCSLFISKYAEFNLEYKYTVERYTTFSIIVKSYNFSGISSFCVSNDELERLVEELNSMSSFLDGKCTLKDSDSDAFVHIEFEKRKLKISGCLGGSLAENSMKFSFFADQTVAKLLSDNFRVFINISS